MYGALFFVISLASYALYAYVTNYDTHINKIDVITEVPEDILESRLCDLHMKTSHNSYIKGAQNFSITSMDIFEKVLERGYVAIELDISEYDNEIYVVHRGDVSNVTLYTTTKMPVEPYFEMIAKFMNKKETFLLLFMEVHMSIDALRVRLSELILKHLKERLIVNSSFATKKLRELMGRICIVTTIPNASLLDKCITTHLYHTSEIVSKDSNYKDVSTSDTLSRIYPAESLKHALSYNYDSSEFHKRGHNCVSMNVNKSDRHMYEYEKFFNGHSFKTKERPI